MAGVRITREGFLGYLATPGMGKGPGVLLLPAWWGLNAFFQATCDRLSEQGLVVFAPDLYGGEVASTIESAGRLRDSLDRRQAERQVADGVDFLLTQPVVSGQAIGVIGFSLGCRYALNAARSRPKVVRAVVLFYGTGGGKFDHTRAAFQGHFAEKDDWGADSSKVTALEARIRNAGRPVEFYTYPRTEHWFFETDRPTAYQRAAADLAWGRSLTFLREHLGGS